VSLEEWAQSGPQWAERIISSHEFWRRAFALPSLTFIPFHPLLVSNFPFVVPALSAFICRHTGGKGKPAEPGTELRSPLPVLCSGPRVPVSSGCLGPRCTLSWSGPTATPPAWAKSGSRCCLFSGSWCWWSPLRASGGTSSLTSPVTRCR